MRLAITMCLVATLSGCASASGDLAGRIQPILAATPATVGISVVDLDTGRRFAIRGGERFPMGSVFKFPVALAVLQRVDRGEMKLADPVVIQPSEFAPGFSPIRVGANGAPVSTTVGELLTAMLRDSDNTAVDALVPRVGGAKAVNAVLRTLGVTGIRIDRSEREMAEDLEAPGGVARYAADERDTSTPEAMTALLTKFHRGEDGLSAASHALAVELMTKTTTGSHRIKALLPAGTVVVHKTGSMPGTANDVGIVTSPDEKHHLAIAIFTKAGDSDRFDDREHAIALLAKEIYDDFTASR